jgi:hypothetical protein
VRERRSKRAAELRAAIANYVEAIGRGDLRSSGAIALALAAAEAELAAIERDGRAAGDEPPNVVALAPRIVRAYERYVADLVDTLTVSWNAETGRYEIDMSRVERAREGLRSIIEEIKLVPDESGLHLVAEMRLDRGRFVTKLLMGNGNIRVVAGAGFEPATFGL